MKRGHALFLFALLWAGFASRAEAGLPVVSNLGAPGGDIVPEFGGTGAAVGFHTGSSSYLLNSVTLEIYGYGGPDPNFHVQLYSLGPPGSATPPGWPLVPFAELNNAGVDPRPWGGGTTLVDYTPGSPLTLSANTTYFVGATVSSGAANPVPLIFAFSQDYGVAPGWSTYVAPNENQWTFDPNYNAWLSEAPNGSEGLKLEINATAVPEPGMLSLGGMALFMAWWRRSRERLLRGN